MRMMRYRAYDPSIDEKLTERMAERDRAKVGEKMLGYYQDNPGKAESDLKEKPMMNMDMETEAKMDEDTMKMGDMNRAKKAMDRIRSGGR